MRHLTRFACALVAIAASAVVTGCSNNGSQFNPTATQDSASLALPKTLRPLVRNQLASLIPIGLAREPQAGWMHFSGRRSGTSQDVAWVSGFEFPSLIGKFAVPNKNNQGPLCQTPGVYAVNNLGVDGSGNLWVPAGNNGPPTGSVQQYTCSGAQGINIVEPYGQPTDVAFDSKGNIVVGDIIDYYPIDGGYYIESGTVNIYNAAGTFVGKLSDPSFFSPHVPGFDIFNILTGVAVDASDNCYVSHIDNTGGGEVVEFPGCRPSSHGKILAGPHPWSPGKPEFDSAGNLIITDYSFAYFYRNAYVSVYAPPYDGPPTKTFPLYGPPVACPLGSDQKEIYCANYINGSVDVYGYPAGKYQYSFNNGLQTYGATGIAVAPGDSK